MVHPDRVNPRIVNANAVIKLAVTPYEVNPRFLHR